jgi:hypothetical protein
MYFHITKLVYLLNLPEEILINILHLVGCIKLRNGLYITQLNRNYKIFKQVEGIPRFINWEVRLPVKTEWFRKSFCDKMIRLENIIYLDINFTVR